MGGFTKIQLKDTSQNNIDEQNWELDLLGVRKWLRFNSEKDVRFEYDGFLAGTGIFPEDYFPRDEIRTYEDFKKLWLAHPFVRPIGALTFDCYFGRTSEHAMHGIARFLLYTNEGDVSVEGSYSTFVERCGYKAKTKQKVLMQHEKY